MAGFGQGYEPRIEDGIFALRGATTMTAADPKEVGGARRQRYNLRRHQQRMIGLSRVALVFGVVYLAVAVVFIAVLFLR